MSDNLDMILSVWRWSLQAEGKSERTIITYTEAGKMFGRWMQRNAVPDIQVVTATHIRVFLSEQLEQHKPATAHNRYRGLRQFFAWLVREGELSADPMAGIRPPHLNDEPPAVLSDAAISALLKACAGTGFSERRDMAIIRLLMDTGMRLGECAGLTVEEVNLPGRVAYVLGKGRRRRSCPYGSKTALAIARYLKARAGHGRADDAALWLGHRGRMTSSGVYQVVKARADAAGVEMHPHLLRHTAAHVFLKAGGQEGDLMRLMGWRSRTMVGRYGASMADERAIDSARRLALGDRV